VIIVAGEALLDRIVWPDGRVVEAPGGGPFNAARTIARLGMDVAFLGRLSSDPHGAMLRRALEDDGVDLRWVVGTDAPTTTAIVELDAEGVATYRFELAGTSAPGLAMGDVLPAFRPGPDAVHVGSLGLAVEPIASSLADGIGQLAARALVMVDPNCRPQVILDREAYLHRLGSVLARADMVKVSVDDLRFIAPGEVPEAAARALVDTGPAVVLLTDGPRTVQVIAAAYTFDVPVSVVEVVDTVGSGDAFGATFLARFMETSGERAGLRDAVIVRDAVGLAIRVASLTCQRPGADPPRRSELTWPTDQSDGGRYSLA
jgi:fructokinase